jgi:hypothetical protein
MISSARHLAPDHRIRSCSMAVGDLKPYLRHRQDQSQYVIIFLTGTVELSED